jgi:DNA-binding Lrp family transcriptional regulator
MTGQIQESTGNPEDILDSVTLKIIRVLLENPKIPYTKTSLAKSADISKDALYNRWETLTETGLVQNADVESGHDHYQLNQDSEIADLLGKLLYDVLEGE